MTLNADPRWVGARMLLHSVAPDAGLELIRQLLDEPAAGQQTYALAIHLCVEAGFHCAARQITEQYQSRVGMPWDGEWSPAEIEAFERAAEQAQQWAASVASLHVDRRPAATVGPLAALFSNPVRRITLRSDGMDIVRARSCIRTGWEGVARASLRIHDRRRERVRRLDLLIRGTRLTLDLDDFTDGPLLVEVLRRQTGIALVSASDSTRRTAVWLRRVAFAAALITTTVLALEARWPGATRPLHAMLGHGAEAVLAVWGPSRDNLRVQSFAAHRFLAAGLRREAIAVLERMLPDLWAFDDVQRGRHIASAFLLARLYLDAARTRDAEALLRRALEAEPSNFEHHLLFARTLAVNGALDAARKHYARVAAFTGLLPEDQALVRIDMAQHGFAERPPIRPRTFIAQRMIELVALNDFRYADRLADMCIYLEYTFQVGCAVTSHASFSFEGAKGTLRGGYNADTLLTRLGAEFPNPLSRGYVMIAVTDKDIFMPGTRFVFSTQNHQTGQAILSTHRLFDENRPMYKREEILMRRLAIQLTSSIGQLFGLPRGGDPNCPLAYPNGLHAFLLKDNALCPSDVQSMQELLARWSRMLPGRATQFTAAQWDETTAVFGRYGLTYER